MLRAISLINVYQWRTVMGVGAHGQSYVSLSQICFPGYIYISKKRSIVHQAKAYEQLISNWNLILDNDWAMGLDVNTHSNSEENYLVGGRTSVFSNCSILINNVVKGRKGILYGALFLILLYSQWIMMFYSFCI